MNEYPTESELRKIRSWDGSFWGLLQFVLGLWHWGDSQYRVYKYDGHYKIELHTGGWSGNEDIIEAFRHSRCLFFFMFHTRWERGGHFYFEVPYGMKESNLSMKPNYSKVLKRK